MTTTTKLDIALPDDALSNKAYVAECKAILQDFRSGKLTKDQFIQAIQYLEEAANAYAKNRKQMWARINKDGVTG